MIVLGDFLLLNIFCVQIIRYFKHYTADNKFGDADR